MNALKPIAAALAVTTLAVVPMAVTRVTTPSTTATPPRKLILEIPMYVDVDVYSRTNLCGPRTLKYQTNFCPIRLAVDETAPVEFFDVELSWNDGAYFGGQLITLTNNAK